MIRILQGDCRKILKTLPDESVHCCVTSPPYMGLRDYQTAKWEGGDPECDHKVCSDNSAGQRTSTLGGSKRNVSSALSGFGSSCGHCGARRIDSQIGLERMPEAYVAELVVVFREVRRVLRKDGTCWLNLGDSYAGGGRGGGADGSKQQTNIGSLLGPKTTYGLKPKDLCMIPARLALALQQPFYTGRIKDERDRVWLAAMIDAEGCMFIHKRKIGQSNGQGYDRKSDSYGAGLEVANCSKEITDRCTKIAGIGSVFRHEKDRRQPLYRWQLRSNECRDVVREVYPYLVAKKHQARLLLSCPSSGPKADNAHQSLIALHNGGSAMIDFPEPPSMYEPGWYLRQDIIWSKLNPMPESVTDRCTKAHEYIFLLTKSDRYYYDAAAIAEPANYECIAQGNMGAVGVSGRNDAPLIAVSHSRKASNGSTRNKRSVWTVATQPYSEAHFATFPPALIEPCILAGCPAKCCAKCGGPWVRYTETTEDTRADFKGSAFDKGKTGSRDGGDRTQSDERFVKRSLGFSPSCSCDAGTVAGTCLDPFGGAGTTGLVADRLQRNAILIELNADYAAMAELRIFQDAPLLMEAAE